MKPAGLHADQGIGVFAGSAGFLFSRKRERVGWLQVSLSGHVIQGIQWWPDLDWLAGWQ
jgi:hypothetical protein